MSLKFEQKVKIKTGLEQNKEVIGVFSHPQSQLDPHEPGGAVNEPLPPFL